MVYITIFIGLNMDLLSGFLAPAWWYKDAIKLIWYRSEGSGGGYISTHTCKQLVQEVVGTRLG